MMKIADSLYFYEVSQQYSKGMDELLRKCIPLQPSGLPCEHFVF